MARDRTMNAVGASLVHGLACRNIGLELSPGNAGERDPRDIDHGIGARAAAGNRDRRDHPVGAACQAREHVERFGRVRGFAEDRAADCDRGVGHQDGGCRQRQPCEPLACGCSLGKCHAQHVFARVLARAHALERLGVFVGARCQQPEGDTDLLKQLLPARTARGKVDEGGLGKRHQLSRGDRDGR